MSVFSRFSSAFGSQTESNETTRRDQRGQCNVVEIVPGESTPGVPLTGDDQVARERIYRPYKDRRTEIRRYLDAGIGNQMFHVYCRRSNARGRRAEDLNRD
jgi:hypothetical protein